MLDNVRAARILILPPERWTTSGDRGQREGHVTHTTTTSTAVKAVPASGAGALSGFEFRCEACAEVARFSFRSMTEAHAVAHVNYMLHKEQGR